MFSDFESNSIYEVLLTSTSGTLVQKLDINEKIKEFVKITFQMNVTEDEFHKSLCQIPQKKDSVIQELVSSCLLKLYQILAQVLETELHIQSNFNLR